jgi:CBS domain-containing protein
LLQIEISFPRVHADQSLDLALECMGTNHLHLLPVVSHAYVHSLLGIVTLSEVLESYGLAIPESNVAW